MKYNNKAGKTLLAIALALPMILPVSNINAAFADNLILKKLDENDSSAVNDAKYTLYQIPDDGKSKELIINANEKTSGEGKIEWNNIPMGSYYAVETEAPEGYLLNISKIEFKSEGSQDKLVEKETRDRKFPLDKEVGQAVIRSLSKSGDAISNAKYELQKKDQNGVYETVAELLTNNSGYIESADNKNNANNIEEVYNQTLLLKAGEYKLKGVSGPENYLIKDKESTFTIEKNKVSKIDFYHELKTIDQGKPKPRTGDTIDKKTGFMLKVIDKKTNKALKDIEISVYEKTKGKLLYKGKTNSNGYLSTNATTGKNLVSDNVLHIPAGEYYYKVNGTKTSEKHYFSVTKNDITKVTQPLNKASNGKSTGKGNNKKKSKSSKLAKTGTEDTTIYTAAGLTLLAAGAVLTMKKKKEIK